MKTLVLQSAVFKPIKRCFLAGCLLLPLLTTTVLPGCSGDSSSGFDPVAEPTPVVDGASDTTATGDLITDDGITDDNIPDEVVVGGTIVDADGDNAGGTPSRPSREPGYYMRDYQYPAMVTLPLQFITTAYGKKLGALVTLPADENGEPVAGSFPVILVQTGYNIHLMSALRLPGMSLLGAPDKLMVRRGYAQVSVDVVGTGVSQGGWEMFGEEEQAGYGDTVDWILQQPWSNGNIGVAGASYMGITALFTAQRRPEAVKAIFAMVPIGDAMRGIVGTGGLINGLFISVWAQLTQALGLQNQLPYFAYPQYRDYIAAVNQEHIDQIDDFFLPLIDAAFFGAPYITYDGDFWRTRSPLEHMADIKAPTLITGALHDIFQRDEPLLYEQLKQNVDARLVIYEGDHITNFLQAARGGDEIDPLLSLYLQWFDKHLKGMNSGAENIPAVTQYVKNYHTLKKSRGLWRGFATTTDWPHPQASAERWYLHGDLTLDRVPQVETETMHSMATPPAPDLAWGKTENGKYLQFDFKFNDGTDCSISYRQWTLGAAGLLDFKPCYYESSQVEAGALNFESAPMQEDYYFNGPVQADIWIESSAADAVLSVRLDEVSPAGTIKQISNGLLLASNRAVDDSRSRFIDGQMIQPFHYLTEARVMPVVPGEVIRLPVELFPSSVIILRGHKLRVSISASNQAQGILNVPRQELVNGSTISVHNSLEYPSSIVLPVVPMSALN